MNRIDKTFKKLRRRKQKALIAFITAGDPRLSTTKELAAALAASGVDILELGMPFSDPLADGPTIQAASQRALKNKIKLKDVFAAVKSLRKKIEIPIVLLTYYNIIWRRGVKNFVREASSCGIDGVVVPDLPVEEAGDLIRPAGKNNFAVVLLAAPTSDTQRLRKICAQGRGFIYYVSLTGTTGTRAVLPEGLVHQVRRIKRLTKKPVCVGFGISSAEQARQIAQAADGIIVGSAIVKIIEKNLKNKELAPRVIKLVAKLKEAL